MCAQLKTVWAHGPSRTRVGLTRHRTPSPTAVNGEETPDVRHHFPARLKPLPPSMLHAPPAEASGEALLSPVFGLGRAQDSGLQGLINGTDSSTVMDNSRKSASARPNE